ERQVRVLHGAAGFFAEAACLLEAHQVRFGCPAGVDGLHLVLVGVGLYLFAGQEAGVECTSGPALPAVEVGVDVLRCPLAAVFAMEAAAGSGVEDGSDLGEGAVAFDVCGLEVGNGTGVGHTAECRRDYGVPRRSMISRRSQPSPLQA